MNPTVVYSFTCRPFSGDPAAIAVLDRFPFDESSQR
jgi:hypothetical protein